MNAKELSRFLHILEARFNANSNRHHGLLWKDVQRRVEANSAKIGSLHEMERTGGEPDVVGQVSLKGELCFVDCSPESPIGRRSLCYDRAAWESRKDNKPKSSAVEMAEAMGIQLLTEEQYRQLQELGEFDTKTSSWIETPADVRALGGSLFADRRYGKVFVYHNGAQSYFAARGFRGWINI